MAEIAEEQEALNEQLNQIESVEDGIFFIPEEVENENQRLRLIAFVVSKQKNKLFIAHQRDITIIVVLLV